MPKLRYSAFPICVHLWFSSGDTDAAFAMGLEEGVIGIDHEFDQIVEFCLGSPAEFLLGFARVADEEIDFGGAVVAGVGFDIFAPVEPGVAEGGFEEFADAVGFAGGDDVIVRFVLLEHEPHGFDVFFGVAPVAFGIEVAEVKAGRDLGPAIPAADAALETGNDAALIHLLSSRLEQRLHERFVETRGKRGFAADDVAAGRVYVNAYVTFLNFVERVHESIEQEPGHHFPED